MAKIKSAGIQDDAVNGSKFKLDNNQSLRARNNANSSDINLFKLNTSDAWEFQQLPVHSGSNIATESFVTTELADYIPTTQKGAANGVAELDGTGKVPSAQLPSYVDDALEYANLAAFPVSGETGKIYVAIDTGKTYRWTGSVYVEISPSEVNSVNGQTGVVVLDTDDISEGSANLYYTASRFNTAFSGKDTDDLTEGSTNLYHTTSRARTAAVVNSTAGNETDQAASVAAMKSYVSTNAPSVAVEFKTLNGTDITNQYIDMAVTANGIIAVDVKGYPTQWLTDDYTVSLTGGSGGVTRISFAGDMAGLVSGDKVKITYK